MRFQSLVFTVIVTLMLSIIDVNSESYNVLLPNGEFEKNLDLSDLKTVIEEHYEELYDDPELKEINKKISDNMLEEATLKVADLSQADKEKLIGETIINITRATIEACRDFFYQKTVTMNFRLILTIIFLCRVQGAALNQLLDWLSIGKVYPDVWNESFMGPIDMLKLYGYPNENYTVTTKDGYILSIYRIPNTTAGSIPILLMHGMGCTATEFFFSQSASPAFILADSGFDVWIGNFRGGPYSSHTKYKPKDKQFWKFSWEEMAVHDLPDSIDYVLKATNKTKLLLAAQSMGTTIGFALFSSQPLYNEKASCVAGFFAITPVAFLNYIPSLVYSHIELIATIVKLLNLEPLGQVATVEGFPLNSSMELCSREKDVYKCALTSSIVAGFNPYLQNYTRMPIYNAHCRFGTSFKTAIHLAQIKAYKGMHKYDYGEAKNKMLYNSLTPPAYNLSAISVPIVIFHGANDALADPLDVELLSRNLNSLVGKELAAAPMFIHPNCMTAMNNKELIYDKLITYAENLWKEANKISDEGYDVWACNFRGTRYSYHSEYSIDMDQYWDFCLDDYIFYDLPAIIDHVLNVTGYSKLFLIGHSLGATVPILTLSAKSEYNDKAVEHSKIKQFDYGSVKNLEKYHTSSPPEYNLNQLTTPIVIFHAPNDCVSTPLDVTILSQKIPNLIKKEVFPEPTASHNDFIWAISAKDLITAVQLGFIENLPLRSREDEELFKEAMLETTEFIKFYGYPAENHTVYTTDGYILTMHRIPHGKSNINGTGKRKPVLLIHGVLVTSSLFLDSGKPSLGFYLADKGYDVWLGNMRGTFYSRHKKYSRKNKKFWDFSWDEIAQYDATAMIDYVLKETGFTKLPYIAHSMGTTVSGFVALSPVGGLVYATTLYRVGSHFETILTIISKLLGMYNPLGLNPKLFKLEAKFCPYPNPVFCSLNTNLFGGYSTNIRNNSRDFLYTNHGASGASLKTLKHFAQLSPSKYPLDKISIPVVVFYSANDALADPIDVHLLARNLRNLIGMELVGPPMMNHVDMTYAIDAKNIYQDKLLTYLKKL
uniref:Partial AB-hydrolase lipase domain-containing protein n=1 Tax=Strigamia maritima TaxID=126957 RepID=T1IT67_STRMM